MVYGGDYAYLPRTRQRLVSTLASCSHATIRKYRDFCFLHHEFLQQQYSKISTVGVIDIRPASKRLQFTFSIWFRVFGSRFVCAVVPHSVVVLLVCRTFVLHVHLWWYRFRLWQFNYKSVIVRQFFLLSDRFPFVPSNIDYPFNIVIVSSFACYHPVIVPSIAHPSQTKLLPKSTVKI